MLFALGCAVQSGWNPTLGFPGEGPIGHDDSMDWDFFAAADEQAEGEVPGWMDGEADGHAGAASSGERGERERQVDYGILHLGWGCEAAGLVTSPHPTHPPTQ